MSNESFSQEKLPFNDLSKAESVVINNKGTEAPFTGKYVQNKEKGTYICKKCGAALYHSSDKFESDCGWPSFDDEIKGAVNRFPDADGMRTEMNLRFMRCTSRSCFYRRKVYIKKCPALCQFSVTRFCSCHSRTRQIWNGYFCRRMFLGC